MSSFRIRVTSIPSTAAERGFPTTFARYIHSKEGKKEEGKGKRRGAKRILLLRKVRWLGTRQVGFEY